MVALGLDDTTTIDGGLEAVGVEILEVDIGNVLPVREEEFHGRRSNTFDGLEVTHIGVGFVFHQLVEKHTVDVFRTEGVHDLREVLNVDCPSLVYHILGNTRQVPAFNEAVEAVKEGGFTETIGKRIEVSIVNRLLVLVQRDIAHQHKAALGGNFLVVNGGLTGFEVSLQSRLNLSRFLEYDGLDFIECRLVVVADDAELLFGFVIEQFCTSHRAAGNNPAVLGEIAEDV